MQIYIYYENRHNTEQEGLITGYLHEKINSPAVWYAKLEFFLRRPWFRSEPAPSGAGLPSLGAVLLHFLAAPAQGGLRNADHLRGGGLVVIGSF